MTTNSSRFASVWVLCGAVFAAAAQERPALRGLDPVELCEGGVVDGVEAHVATHGRFTYRFSSAETLKRFQADPGRFSIRYAGACARMGPLSEEGDPDRFLVHAGRIYIFALEECRKSFQKQPERHIDKPDSVPPHTGASWDIGEANFKKMVEELGGEKAVDAATTWEIVVKQPYESREGKGVATIVTTWGAPGKFRKDETVGRRRRTLALNGAAGVSIVEEKRRALEGEECAYLARQALFHPLAFAQARKISGFQSLRGGMEKVGKVDIEWLRVWVADTAAEIGVDSEGRAVIMQYQGRMAGPIGKIVKRYSDFKKVGDLTLPHKVETEFDGKPEAAPTVIDSIRINPPLAEGFWSGR